MVIDNTSFVLPKANYFQEEFAKDCIVLHYTAGNSAYSAYQTWIAPDSKGRPQHIATPFVVGPSTRMTDPCKVFQFFDPKHWAYHLNMASNNPNWANDKRTIPIEITNPGQLVADKRNPNQLNWWPGNWSTKWCTLDETSKYIKISSYRGFSYFATYPKEQLLLVKELVNMLCVQFNIQKTVPQINKYLCEPRLFSQFKGVASHVNFNSQKLDLNPSCESWYNNASLFS